MNKPPSIKECPDYSRLVPVSPKTQGISMKRDTLASISKSSSRKENRSRSLNRIALEMMECWYKFNFRHPYPSTDIVSYIVKHGQVTAAQVKKWMANKRVRSFNTLSFNGAIHPKRLKRLRKEASAGSSLVQSCSQHHNPADKSTYNSYSEYLSQIRSTYPLHYPSMSRMIK